MKKLPLRGNTEFKFALVDDDIFEEIAKFKWYISKSLKYPYRNNWDRTEKKNTLILLHKLVMEFPETQVDHTNRDRLDCRRENLRLATAKQNSQNRRRDRKFKTSRFHGVHKRKDGRWIASIRVDGILRHIGSFVDEENAARAYDDVARDVFGDFCILNFDYHS